MAKEKNTKNEILKSAVRLFSNNNYHAVSMIEIAEGAEVSKGTVYWYFNSKKELFREIIINGLEYFNEYFKKISESEEDFESKIHQIIKTVIGTVFEHIDMITVIRNNVELINKEFQSKLERRHRENIDIFSQIIEEGMEKRIIKDGNARNISLMILSVLFAPHIKEIIKDINGIDNQVKFINDFIMNGISRKE